MSFFRNAASVLFTSAVLVPVGVVSGVVLTRNLSVEDRGTFGVVAALLSTAVLFLNLGWPASAVFRIKRLGLPPARVAGQGLAKLALLSLAVVGVGVLASEPLGALLGANVPTNVLFWTLVTVPCALVIRYLSFVAQAIERFDLRSWAVFLGAMLRLAGLAAALYFVPGNLLACVLAVFGAQLAIALFSTVSVLRCTGFALRGPPDPPETASQTRAFSFASYTQNMLGELHEHVDILMLGLLLTDKSEVAIYGVAVTVVTQLKLVPDSIATALFPRIAGESPEQAARFASMVSRHATAAAILGALGLALVGPTLVELLYGEAYAASATPLRILLPGMAVYTAYRVLARYFVALGRQRVNITTQALAVTVNIGLNLWLIPRHGAVGAAVASLVSYSLEALLVGAAFLRASGRTFRETFVFDWSRDREPYLRRLRARFRA